MRLLCSSFVVHHNHIIRKKAYLLAAGNKVGFRLYFWIQKLLLTNSKTKLELWSVILLLYSRLTSAIFIADVSYTCWGEFNYFWFTSAIFCHHKNICIRKAEFVRILWITDLIFLKVSSLKSSGWTRWLVKIFYCLLCSFWRLIFNLPAFQIYRNHPINLQWHNARNSTWGRLSLIVTSNVTKSGTPPQVLFPAFCHCKLLGWFL